MVTRCSSKNTELERASVSPDVLEDVACDCQAIIDGAHDVESDIILQR
jgi:hypothetical protein